MLTASRLDGYRFSSLVDMIGWHINYASSIYIFIFTYSLLRFHFYSKEILSSALALKPSYLQTLFSQVFTPELREYLLITILVNSPSMIILSSTTSEF
jgi:hypothetical protein